MSNHQLPPLPAGQRWRVRTKRAWVFADLQRKTRFCWKTTKSYDYYDVARRFDFLGSEWA